jgi:hypothetical protein
MKWEMPFHSEVFVARTGFEPDADCDRANVRHLLGDDGEAVGQHLFTDTAGFF